MSFAINSVVVSGNLTRDPELRSLPSGTSLCAMSIAHNGRRKNGAGEWEDEVHYFDVTVWGGQGEWISRNLSKGAKVVVQGRLRQRRWETEDGGKRSAVDITADNVTTGGKDGGGDGGGRSRDGGDATPPDSSYSDPIAGTGGMPASGFAPAGTPQDEIPF